MDKFFIQAVVGDKNILGVVSKADYNDQLHYGFAKGLMVENPVAFQRMMDPRGGGGIQVAALSFFTLGVLGKPTWCCITAITMLGEVTSCAAGTECLTAKEFYGEYQNTLEQMRTAKLRQDTGLILPK